MEQMREREREGEGKYKDKGGKAKQYDGYLKQT